MQHFFLLKLFQKHLGKENSSQHFQPNKTIKNAKDPKTEGSLTYNYDQYYCVGFCCLQFIWESIVHLTKSKTTSWESSSRLFETHGRLFDGFQFRSKCYHFNCAFNTGLREKFVEVYFNCCKKMKSDVSSTMISMTQKPRKTTQQTSISQQVQQETSLWKFSNLVSHNT